MKIGIDIAIFLSKCDSIPIPYCPRGTGDRCRRSQNGFYTPANPITPSAEEFISASPNIGVKNRIDIEFFIKKIEIELRGKTIVTSVLRSVLTYFMQP